ncbi:YugN family protein [Lentibacillus sp. Marseille-P4043]|uniref:YugN family protein n=1 Tax=Lentibacillus sp. Marseille-P4043 TaxID=2040293 RepID=UPI000D0B2C62|nr:YugN family protein [Lentibacillus sp. Marseille-P4043]
MIELQTELEGKKTYYRNVLKHSKRLDYTLGGCWDYHKGCLDSILWREAGETIYLRLPFKVLEGELDRPNALIEFEKPYVIKHVVNTGLDKDVNALATVSGFSQFQDPLDQDGRIKDKNEWEENGEQAVDQIVDQVSFL